MLIRPLRYSKYCRYTGTQQSIKREHSTDLICMNQHHECISLAAGIFLIDKKIMDQLWSIRDEIFKIPKPKRQSIACSLINMASNMYKWKAKLMEQFVPIDGIDC